MAFLVSQGFGRCKIGKFKKMGRRHVDVTVGMETKCTHLGVSYQCPLQ